MLRSSILNKDKVETHVKRGTNWSRNVIFRVTNNLFIRVFIDLLSRLVTSLSNSSLVLSMS